MGKDELARKASRVSGWIRCASGSMLAENTATEERVRMCWDLGGYLPPP
jgi:hypothetical protein